MVLYRECDFRGRKLLFDSTSIEKVSIIANDGEREKGGEKFAEITDTFGYMVSFL